MANRRASVIISLAGALFFTAGCPAEKDPGDGSGGNGGSSSESSTSSSTSSTSSSSSGTAGSEATTLVSSLKAPIGIAVDATSIYWTDLDAGAVMKVPIAGGSPIELASGQFAP